MAGFHTKKFKIDDEYMTPKYAWENIQQYIPKGKVIWEAFMGDSNSGEFLRELGFDTIHDNDDFFESDKGDIVVSNPPFSKKKEVFQRLKEIDKPFIIICPINMINTLYIRNLFKDSKDRLQIIIPRKRIQFIKVGAEENKCNFDCFYYCYKIGLDHDIIWLD